MKYQWNLKKQYKSLNDNILEKDIQKIGQAYRNFEKKYKNDTSFLEKPTALLKALKEFEKLFILPKPLSYLFLSKSIDTNNKTIDAKISLVQQRIINTTNRIIFFRLALGAVTKEKQEIFLKSSILKEYHYFLENVFKFGKHDLSEKENQLLNELSMPASEMWIDLTERLQSERVISLKNTLIPLSAANGLLPTLSSKDRKTLWKQIVHEFKADSSVAEAELNALYTTKAVLDKKRGFIEPFDETLIDFETSTKELKSLRDAVTENIDISHDFYAYKKEELKLSVLTYADRNVDLGSFKNTFSFDDSKKILLDIFGKSHPRFKEILSDMLKEKRIDVFPRKGKTSGAFCSGNIEFPTFVLLNHVDTFDSLSTFAHEMGHAIHTELAKSQPPLYQGYSTATAEFASTFFEEILFNSIATTLSKRDQKILLHNRINRDIATVFRQMAFFEFELKLHEEVRRIGYVSKERIAELLNEKTKEYLGNAVTLSEDDGYFFVPLSHIRRHFYVYSYAYGGLLSRLISRQAVLNPELFEGVVALLSSGSKKSPHDLFKEIGFNTESKKTFKDALSVIRTDLEHLKGM